MITHNKCYQFCRLVLLIILFSVFLRLNAQINNYLSPYSITSVKQFIHTDTTYLSNSTIPEFDCFRNETAGLGKKLLRGMGLTMGYNVTMGLSLLAMPQTISQWDKDTKLKWSHIKGKYRETYTLPPVIDKDLWIINYIGHPYQGSFYYNNLRSQGADIWSSSAYTLAQTLLWEYVIEAGLERPSIQDLIITPTTGVFFGELSHRATLQMRKNGFNTFEKIIVCLMNPSYAINNGFRTKKSK